MKDTLSVRLSPEIKDKLEKMARATARTKSFLVADAIQQYLSVNEWQIQAIQEGIQQADEGQLISHEEVVRAWEAKLADPVE
jgi:RHH-type rel operon transcriptional repressor/antitoxin RelB